MKNTKMIGLSLSSCVVDLLEGRISYPQVRKLITGTAAPDDGTWHELMDEYVLWYWWGEKSGMKPQERLSRAAVALANRLRSEGKIEQPRLTKQMAPLWFGDRRWVVSEEEIAWVKDFR